MKKILLVLHPANLNREAIDFACYLSKVAHTGVTGVFLKEGPWWFAPNSDTNRSISEVDALRDEQEQAVLDQAFLQLRASCTSRDTQCFLHKDRCISLEELLVESRFSDLMVIAPNFALGPEVEPAPSSLVKHVLMNSGCPVVLAPDSFDTVSELVFAYNGSKASVFALKQFTYLFPEFRDKPATILTVGDQKPDNKNALVEWADRHYSQMKYDLLQGDAVPQLTAFLLARKNALVIMGAFGRNAFSLMMKKSTVEPVSGTLFHPIFISH